MIPYMLALMALVLLLPTLLPLLSVEGWWSGTFHVCS